MRSLYESILDSDEQVAKNAAASYFVNNIISITKSYYANRTKISDTDKLLLEKLWRENDLEIPGMKWYFTRYEGLQYGPAIGLCVPIIQIHESESDCISLAVHSRKGIDYSINSLHLPNWEKVAKQETKKITDAFLKKYNRKLSNILNMKPIEGESEYFISRYELN